MGTLKTTNIQSISGSGTVTLGTSGETFALGTGAKSSFLYPAFEAKGSAEQTGVSDNTWTKVTMNTEIFDTNSMYDASTNYRFTPTVAGKYYVYATVRGTAAASTLDLEMTAIYLNGATYIENQIDWRNNDAQLAGICVNAIIDMNGSSDYVECYGRCLGGTTIKASPTRCTLFGAYKLIGA